MFEHFVKHAERQPRSSKRTIVNDPESRSSDAGGQASGARLLLAEDDFELRELLAALLRADGHEVVEARDGYELLDFLTRSANGNGTGAFSVIVSDVRMPGLTALDVLSRLRGELTSTPVILITAFGDRNTHLRALLLGASRVFDKPFDCDELRGAVQDALQAQAQASRAD